MIRRIIDRFFIKQPRIRRLVTAILYGKRDRKVVLFGQTFTINSVRENGYLRASRKSQGSSLLEAEAGVLVTLALVCGLVDTFVDAGANIGIFSCLMARRRMFDPGFRVMAFEPHPDTFRRLAANAREHGVEAHNVALSDRNGTLEFVDGAVSHVFTARETANAYNLNNEVIAVSARRLDSMGLEGRSILLKVDVEGQEYEVLQGAAGLIRSGAIAAIYIDGFDGERVPKFLLENGFELFDLHTLKKSDRPEFALMAMRPEVACSFGRQS